MHVTRWRRFELWDDEFLFVLIWYWLMCTFLSYFFVEYEKKKHKKLLLMRILRKLVINGLFCKWLQLLFVPYVVLIYLCIYNKINSNVRSKSRPTFETFQPIDWTVVLFLLLKCLTAFHGARAWHWSQCIWILISFESHRNRSLWWHVHSCARCGWKMVFLFSTPSTQNRLIALGLRHSSITSIQLSVHSFCGFK